MYGKLLVATDGSELAGRAVDHGLQLAKAVGASVAFVNVTEMWSAMQMAAEIEHGKMDAVKEYESAAADVANKILDAAKAKAEAAGVSCTTHHIHDKHPAEGIIEVADLEDCDLIVMASHGRRGLEKMLIGSETAEVLTFSKRPVLVLR